MSRNTDGLRRRMANEAGFQELLTTELVIRLGLEFGIVSGDGVLDSEESERAVNPAPPKVGGRPLRHYAGLSRQQVVDMVGENGLRELSAYLKFEDETPAQNESRRATTGYFVTGAAVPPAGIPDAGEDGTVHPDMLAWGEANAGAGTVERAEALQAEAEDEGREAEAAALASRIAAEEEARIAAELAAQREEERAAAQAPTEVAPPAHPDLDPKTGKPKAGK